MSGNRFRNINQWYYADYEAANDSNDAADDIIRNPDRHLVSQEQLFDLNGGWSTVGFGLAAVAAGQMGIMVVAPRTAHHFRHGTMQAMCWGSMIFSAFACYNGASIVGRQAFGNPQAYHNHWMAYTYVKAQNRYQGRRILTNAPSY